MKKCSVDVQLESHYYMGCRLTLMRDPRFKSNDGKRNVVVRINYKSNRNYLHIYSPVDDYTWEKICSANKGEHYRTRVKIVNKFRDVCDVVEDNIDSGQFDIDIIKSRIIGGRTITLRELSELYSNGKSLNSRNKVRNSVRSATSFMGDIMVGDITKGTIERWKDKMEMDGLSSTTMHIYMATVQAVLSTAINKGIIHKSPFDGVKLPRDKKRRECYLTLDEITDLYGKSDDEAVRWFMISYLCNGINPADLAAMRYGDHYFRTGGKELSYSRAKTAHHEMIEIYIPITDHLRFLLDECAAKPSKGSLVFPQIWRGASDEDQRQKEVHYFCTRTNKALKKYYEKLSLTWARHSYKTTLMILGVPEVFTEQMLGHSDNSVGSFYRGYFTYEDRLKYNSLLIK